MGQQPANRTINTGTYIEGGVYTEGGSYINGDQVNNTLVSAYVFQGEDAAERYRLFAQDRPQPYHPDRPFHTLEEPLFTGREEHIQQIVERLSSPHCSAIAIYGPPDMGKTSMLTAGIIPRLVQNGALVIHLQDYIYPIPCIRRELLRQAQALGLTLGERTPVPELVKTVNTASQRGIVLILDQFERFFMAHIDPLEAQALRRDLPQALEAVGPSQFKVIIAIRSDLQTDLDREWGDLLPDLRQSPVHLTHLTRQQARQAIEHPLTIIRSAFYNETVLDNQILPDLDALDDLEESTILPADLQIVCSRLYEAAQTEPKPLINENLYLKVSQGKGAEQIIDWHFEHLLGNIPEMQSDLARQIAAAMLDPGLGFWVTPGDLQIEAARLDEIAATLEAMAGAGLLVWHTTGEQRAYAFASNSLAKAAYRTAGPEVQKRHQARNELEYVWRAWVTYNAWASRGQLNYLRTYCTNRPYPPERALLLLRSSVLRQVEHTAWLERLRQEDAALLLKRLEMHAPPDPQSDERLSRLSQASLLLGMHEMPEYSPNPAFGPLAWNAAANPDPVCREAACLALHAVYPEESLQRLEAAVQSGKFGSRRSSEMRGILSDADPQIAKQNTGLPVRQRLAVWGWRARRRFNQQAAYIGAVALGGALGAGFALGLLRAVLGFLLGEQGGFFFYNYFPMGFLTGGALALGLLLVNVLRLSPPETSASGSASRPLLPSLGMGALFFALLNILLNLQLHLGALIAAPLIPPLAFIQGLALSQAVYDQPQAGWRLGPLRWILRLGLAAILSALVQAAFVLAKNFGVGLVYSWSLYFYESRLYDRFAAAGGEPSASLFAVLSMFDAALAGLALALGLAAGMVIAGNWHRRWKDLVERAAA